MLRSEELGGYCWADEKGNEQQVLPAVLRPLFELVAQERTITNDDDYDFTANAFQLQDIEWETFIQASLNAVPLFCLKYGKCIAKSHLLNHWSAIPDNNIELENAVREEIDTEDEKASGRQVDGNGFQQSHLDDDIEQSERNVCQRVDETSTALTLLTGSTRSWI